MPTPKKPLPEGLRPEDMESGSGEAPMEAGTLSGDVRDVLLTHVRSMKVPWDMLGEDEQREKIEAISSCAFDVVRRTVSLITSSGFPSIQANVGAYKVDKGLEVKLTAPGSVEAITKLAEHGKGSAVLVLAEAADFFGERAPAKAKKNQPPLPLEDTDED